MTAQPFDFVENLICPASLAQSNPVDLVQDGKDLVSAFDRYPIVEGVADLRLTEDRKGTSYDEILPEWDSNELDQDTIVRLAKAFGLKREYVEGKTVLIAGVGGGTELQMILAFNPAMVYAIDFSGFIVSLSKIDRFKKDNVRFFAGDLCNLPFKNSIFDCAINGGIMHHTRTPELAHRNIWRTVRPGGHVLYGHIYLNNLHNRRVSIDRNRLQYHKMPIESAKQKLRTMAKRYKFLLNSGILSFFYRNRFRIPLVPEMNGIKGQSLSYYTGAAFDYYLCRYRHVIDEDEVLDWFVQTGGEAVRTQKGFLGNKPLQPATASVV